MLVWRSPLPPPLLIPLFLSLSFCCCLPLLFLSRAQLPDVCTRSLFAVRSILKRYVDQVEGSRRKEIKTGRRICRMTMSWLVKIGEARCMFLFSLPTPRCLDQVRGRTAGKEDEKRRQKGDRTEGSEERDWKTRAKMTQESDGETGQATVAHRTR